MPSPLADLFSDIPGVELLAIERTMGALIASHPDASMYLLFAKELYDAELGSPPSAATPEEEIALFASAGAELGEGVVRVATFGRGEPFELGRVRPTSAFEAWAPRLLERAAPTSAFVLSEARDVAVFLQRHSTSIVVRVAHGFASKLLAAADRARATREAHSIAEVARARGQLEAFGVAVEEATDLPSRDAFNVPWDESDYARRLSDRSDPSRVAWLTARLALLDAGASCFVWRQGMGKTWLALRAPPDASWIAALWSDKLDLFVLSSDRLRVLALRITEYDDIALVVSVAALLDRARSIGALDALVHEAAGLRLAYRHGPRDIHPPSLFRPSRRLERARLDEVTAARWLAALVGDFDMAECFTQQLKDEGVVGSFSLSLGHQAPLAFRGISTYDDGRWLVELWRSGVEQLVVGRLDGGAFLALRRHGEEVDALLSNPRRRRR